MEFEEELKSTLGITDEQLKKLEQVRMSALALGICGADHGSATRAFYALIHSSVHINRFNSMGVRLENDPPA